MKRKLLNSILVIIVLTFSVQLMAGDLDLGAGDNLYSIDVDFTLVNVGVSISKDNDSTTYIINPNQKTFFLTFGISF